MFAYSKIPRHPRAALLVTLSYLALALWFGFGGLFVYFDYTRPKSPNISMGQVYANNNHGSIFYLNRTEEVEMFGLEGCSLATIVVTGVLCSRWKISLNDPWSDAPPYDYKTVRATYKAKDVESA